MSIGATPGIAPISPTSDNGYDQRLWRRSLHERFQHEVGEE